MLTMSNEMFTQLPTVTNALAADIICAIQGGVSVQETLEQVLNLTQSNIVLSGSGNPNGSVAGSVYQFYYDTTNKNLYINTTTGSSSTAVWTLVASNAFVPALTNGQLLIGSTGVNPVPATLTAGSNISITNAAGSITIAGTGFAGFSWTVVASSSQAITPNSGYIMNNGASLVTLTLPVTAPVGSLIGIQGASSGGWAIAQNSGQTINIGSVASTIGVGGSIASTNAHDSLLLVCTVANTNFASLGAPQGNITIV
jgi:hypothetical protein